MTTIGLYSDSQVIGGAERSLLNLAAATCRDVDLVVCSPYPDLLDAARHIDGIDTHLLRARTSSVTSVVDHRREFLALGLDLLQVTLANPFASRSAVVGGVLARTPTITVEQLVLPSRRRRGRLMKRLTVSVQSGVVAVGAKSADDLHRYFGIPREAISVVHNGVPMRTFDRPSPGSIPVLGCAARLEDQKGVDVLLRALAQLPDARLVIAGDGHLRASLERLRDELGLTDRVEFLGWIADAPAEMARWDIFVLPSRDEAFPLTIVEAMFAGVPVIATDVGSVSEAVRPDDTGVLVPAEDVDALVAAIRRLISSDDLRRRLAVAAHEHASANFTDQAMAEGYLRIWRSVSGKRQTLGR